MTVRVNGRLFRNLADAGKFLLQQAAERKPVKIEHLDENDPLWRNEQEG